MSSANTPSTSTPLQLFPSPSSYMPRKSSLKQPRSATSSPAPALKGVKLQVTTAFPTGGADNTAHPDTNNASSAISTSGPAFRGPPKTRLHARKRSSAPSLPNSPAAHEPLIHEDQLCPLPVNTSFSQSSPPRIRTPVGRLKRPSTPRSISTQAPQEKDVSSPIDGDKLSPLPTKLFFKQTAPPKQEYPSPVSFRSDATTLVRSNSDATGRSPSSAISNPPQRSMFPQYDHTKSLSQQHYFPQVSVPPIQIPLAKVSSTEGTPPQVPLKRKDSAVALLSGYEDVSRASPQDMLTIWHASTTTCPPIGRKVQLDIQQPVGHGMSLTLGANGSALYTMQTSNPDPSPKPKEESKDLSIHKTCPESALPIPISQLSLPPSTSKSSATSPPTTLFPHQAALDAIQTAANTPLASAIAASDPTGTSPAAARLAQNAVSQAHRLHTCTIRRVNRHRDTVGAVTAQYTLAHSSLGNLAITVSPAGNSSRDPKAIISLHHPRATPAALSAHTLALLTLDFASQVCVLDTPGLLALDEPYMLDVAVSAVLAVAVLENELLVQEMVQFEPPPTAAVLGGKDGSKGKVKGAEKRKAKRLERKKRDREAGRESGLIRETVSLVGMGVKGAVWLLKTARDSARGPPGT